MNPMMMAVMIVLAVLASCSGGGSGNAPARSAANSGAGATDATSGALHKVEGPPIDRLSMGQIEAIVQTCFAHHDLDDARVPYTRTYCEKVFSERDQRSMKIPAKSAGKAAPDSLH
jgi:hypothetical protein